VELRGKELDIAACLAVHQIESVPVLLGAEKRIVRPGGSNAAEASDASGGEVRVEPVERVDRVRVRRRRGDRHTASEPEIKRIVLNRKNSFFVGKRARRCCGALPTRAVGTA
jgi:hypothetical protein